MKLVLQDLTLLADCEHNGQFARLLLAVVAFNFGNRLTRVEINTLYLVQTGLFLATTGYVASHNGVNQFLFFVPTWQTMSRILLLFQYSACHFARLWVLWAGICRSL